MKYAFPVAMGIIATLAAGILMLPAVYIIFDSFFELYLFSTPPKGAWINDTIVIFTVVIWFLVSSAAGGFIAVQFATEKKKLVVFLLMASSFVIGYLLTKGFLFSLEALPLIVILILGYTLGSWRGIRYKKKRLMLAQQ